MLALGKSTPATACMASVIRPSRRPWDEDDDRRAGDHPREHGVEAVGVAEAAVQRALGAEDVADGVARRERERAGADQRRVQQHERDDRPGHRAEPQLEHGRGGAGVSEVPGLVRVPEGERRYRDQDAAPTTTTTAPMIVSRRS